MAENDGTVSVREFMDSGIKVEVKAVVDEMQRLVKVTSDLMGVIRQSTNDQKAYVTVQKEVENVSKDIVAVESKMKVLDTDIAREAERKRQAYRKASKEQKDNIAAETSAYKKLSNEYGKALQKAKDLAAQYGVQSEQAKKAIATAKGFNDQLKAIDASMGNHQRNVGIYAEAIETANMSLGEMKRTLKELRNIPLVGKTPEEVAQINKQIAMLTDEMGDYQARMRSSGDSVQVMIEGLQGVVAVAQGVTGALSAMGFDTEKLDKAMVQLIGVSQALATVHELNEKQTLKTISALIKEKATVIASAIAQKGLTMATEGTTAATRLMGHAMSKIGKTGLLAIIAAIATALALAYSAIKKYTTELKRVAEIDKISVDAKNKYLATLDTEKTRLNQLFESLKKTNKGSTERKEVLDEINRIYPGLLEKYNLEKATLQEIETAQRNANNELERKIIIQAKDKAAADIAEKMVEAKVKEFELNEKLIEQQEILQKVKEDPTNYAVGYAFDIQKGINFLNDEIKKNSEELGRYQKEYQEIDDYFNKQLGINNNPLLRRSRQNQGGATGGGGGGTTPEKTALDELTDAIAAANEQHRLRIELLKNEETLQGKKLMMMTADIELSDAIYQATKRYYETDAKFSENELEGLRVLDAKTRQLEAQKKAFEELINVQKDAPVTIDPFSGFQKRSEAIPAPVQGELIETELQKLLKAWEQYGKGVEDVYANIGTVITNTFDRQSVEIDKQQAKSDEFFERRLKAYEGDAAATEQLNAQKAAADAKLERERKTIAIRAAKFEKVQALLSIGLSQSKAVMSILADTTIPTASKPFLIAGAISTGLAQTAAVMSKPIPAYASGIESTSKTGAALVGERGSEAILYPDGSVAIADKPTVAILPKGTEVKNAFDTEDYLRKLSFAAMLPRIGKTDANEKDYTTMLKDIHRTLKRGNTVINQGMSAREQYYYKKYSV